MIENAGRKPMLERMNTHVTLDRESLQGLLANAFAVQESQMDIQSLSSVFEIQRSIASGGIEMDAALQLIADRTKNIAGASGVAIALLKEDQLVYRAGSGNFANHTGRRVSAALIVSTGTGVSREMLRVENADTDKRTEGAICQQFGSKALLILVIYHGGAAAGVLEVHFHEPHSFQDREVRIYQLMAGLVGDAISNHHEGTRSIVKKITSLPSALARLPVAGEEHDSASSEAASPPAQHPADRNGEADTAIAAEESLPPSSQSFTTPVNTPERKGASLFNTRRTLALIAIVTVFLMASWIRYFLRYPGSPYHSPIQDRSSVSLPPVPYPKTISNLRPSPAQLRITARNDSKPIPVRAPVERSTLRTPKPSPILEYRAATVSAPVSVQNRQAPVSIPRTFQAHRSTASPARKPKTTPPQVASSSRHPVKVQTSAMQHASAAKRSSPASRPAPRLTAQKQKHSKHAPPSKSPTRPVESQVAKKLPADIQKPLAPSPSNATQTREPENEVAVTDTESEPTSPSDNVMQSESDPSTSDSPPATNASTTYNEAWRRTTTQHRSAPSDDAWRRRRANQH